MLDWLGTIEKQFLVDLPLLLPNNQMLNLNYYKTCLLVH